MSIVVTLDDETTITNKGNPYDTRNKICTLALKVTSPNSDNLLTFTSPWDVGLINEILYSAKTLVGFNIKFDLAWLRRTTGFIPNIHTNIHDCQYAEFLFSNQTWKYPDLETACENRGLGKKYDFIKKKYWDNGIDTDQIPIDELLDYNKQDVEITYQLYQAQLKLLENEYKSKANLFKVAMWDLPVLLEMEWNGLLYNKEKSIVKSKELEKQILSIENILNEIAGLEINWGSGDERSAFLYGGQIKRNTKVPIGVYKSGIKAGQVKFKNLELIEECPRRIEPLPNTEYIKGEVWSTDEPTLRSLKLNKDNKKIVDFILQRAKLEKLNGTYLLGLPKKMETMYWGDYLHPSYNQCVAVTGRISSSNPNGQNIPEQGKLLIESRF